MVLFPRKIILTFRVTEGEKEYLVIEAKKGGVSVSKFIRECIRHTFGEFGDGKEGKKNEETGSSKKKGQPRS